MGQQKRARPTAGCRSRSLTAGMAAAHDHNIKGQIRACHVRPITALLADTEVPEDDIENFLDTHAPGQPAKGEKRRAQCLRRQLRKGRPLSLGQQRRRFGQCRAMAGACQLIALPCTRQAECRFSKAAP